LFAQSFNYIVPFVAYWFSTRGRFHHRFSRAFFVRLIQNVTRKKTFVQKMRAKNVGEIDPLCQFHHYFTSSFFANFLASIFKHFKYTEKLLRPLLYKKVAHKIKMKLTPAMTSHPKLFRNVRKKQANARPQISI